MEALVGRVLSINRIEGCSLPLSFSNKGHCFNDANKRTSFLATFAFFDLNGYDFCPPEQEMVEWNITLANHENRPEFSAAVDWIRKYMHVRIYE
ncbi:type II toxin-antitoxin system death-on-curing family toxin [Fictibacillus enclensis]|uniref:type II toxin-antitoxin system death-on-curing family toxin n=1 Tax=Fictibacillus enclensis TaxID=1017270 RepID=UPI003336A402